MDMFAIPADYTGYVLTTSHAAKSVLAGASCFAG
jgi:hypothetical protein